MDTCGCVGHNYRSISSFPYHLFYFERKYCVYVMDIWHFVLFCRERPKFQAREDGETPRNGLKPAGEASGTVKVTRDSGVEDTLRVRLDESLVSLFLGCHIHHICEYWLSCTNLQ